MHKTIDQSTGTVASKRIGLGAARKETRSAFVVGELEPNMIQSNKVG